MSLEELRELRRRGGFLPARPDAEEIELDDSFWSEAKLMPALFPPDNQRAKASVHLRVDPDVLAWFKAQGRGHLTRMNAVLRAYYEANRKRAS